MFFLRIKDHVHAPPPPPPPHHHHPSLPPLLPSHALLPPLWLDSGLNSLTMMMTIIITIIVVKHLHPIMMVGWEN